MKKSYDFLAGVYDLFTWGAQKRFRTAKIRLFSSATGKTLLVGVGTGIDLPLMPPGLDITAIDVSPAMLERATRRAIKYQSSIMLAEVNIEQTEFSDNYFDTVITSCVFCSVQNPVKGLKEIRRILKPGGRLIMAEHVLSQNPLLKPMLYFMNVIFPSGPDFTRDTVANVKAAGFKVISNRNLYMDIVKAVEAQ